MCLEVSLMAMAIASLLFGCHAAVYKVGDSAGWTTIGNVDYKQWAATKNFQIGDVINFQYNPQFHNVMEVRHAMFRTCNSSEPIATYTTGNDTINITRHGHHYFFCAVPGHCQAGQKVDINVIRTTVTAKAPSATNLPPPATVPASGIPRHSPTSSSSSSNVVLSTYHGSLVPTLVGLVVLVFGLV